MLNMMNSLTLPRRPSSCGIMADSLVRGVKKALKMITMAGILRSICLSINTEKHVEIWVLGLAQRSFFIIFWRKRRWPRSRPHVLRWMCLSWGILEKSRGCTNQVAEFRQEYLSTDLSSAGSLYFTGSHISRNDFPVLTGVFHPIYEEPIPLPQRIHACLRLLFNRASQKEILRDTVQREQYDWELHRFGSIPGLRMEGIATSGRSGIEKDRVHTAWISIFISCLRADSFPEEWRQYFCYISGGETALEKDINDRYIRAQSTSQAPPSKFRLGRGLSETVLHCLTVHTHMLALIVLPRSARSACISSRMSNGSARNTYQLEVVTSMQQSKSSQACQ